MSWAEVKVVKDELVKSKIIVKAIDSQFYNKPVTCSIPDGETLSTTFDANGNAEFRVKYLGRYTITCDGVENSIGIGVIGKIYKLNFSTHKIYAFFVHQNEADPDFRVTYPAGCENENFTPCYYDEDDNFHWGDWENTFIASCFRPCMLKFDSTVDYYLDPDDYSKKEDGTPSDISNTSYPGNAMIEWGQNGRIIYYKIERATSNMGADFTVYIADYKADDDYMCWPFLNNQGHLMDHFYTAIYPGRSVSDKQRSLSGLVMDYSETVDYTKAIRRITSNNLDSDVLWYNMLLCDNTLIGFLSILISKSTNFSKFTYSGPNASDSAHYSTGLLDTHGTFAKRSIIDPIVGGSKQVHKMFGMENMLTTYIISGLVYTFDNSSQTGYTFYKLTYGQEDGSPGVSYDISTQELMLNKYRKTYNNGMSKSEYPSSGGYLKILYSEDGGLYNRPATLIPPVKNYTPGDATADTYWCMYNSIPPTTNSNAWIAVRKYFFDASTPIMALGGTEGNYLQIKGARLSCKPRYNGGE